ncbi:unnamed protein product, partial [Rotaria sordida]
MLVLNLPSIILDAATLRNQFGFILVPNSPVEGTEQEQTKGSKRKRDRESDRMNARTLALSGLGDVSRRQYIEYGSFNSSAHSKQMTWEAVRKSHTNGNDSPRFAKRVKVDDAMSAVLIPMAQENQCDALEYLIANAPTEYAMHSKT